MWHCQYRGGRWHCRLQTECAHYRTVADEAYRLLTDMRDRGILSQSQTGQLCDWLELVDEVGLGSFILFCISGTFLKIVGVLVLSSINYLEDPRY